MFSWLDLTQIILLLIACYLCHLWGQASGMSSLIDVLLEKKMITEEDLDKLSNS